MREILKQIASLENEVKTLSELNLLLEAVEKDSILVKVATIYAVELDVDTLRTAVRVKLDKLIKKEKEVHNHITKTPL